MNKHHTERSQHVKQIGIRIRRVREYKGMSLTEVAARCGLSKGYLSTIEKGTANPTIGVLIDIANAMEAFLAEFFYDEARWQHIFRC